MDKKTKARFEARAKIVKAMSHGTRLFILSELEKDKRCVQELTELIGADMSTVSKHLSILKNAGLVSCEKRGTTVFYELRCTCLGRFFECIEAVLATNLKKDQEACEACGGQ